ncbi:fatty acyl-AMP ligase [Microcoleus sp. OTE_8_concoct_300]|uniref:fatty acyl-AMP ligase n=1 Tax=Microcoleus sp. OTE_8_concoct_300 TaxID=2964710 RepID=UPI00403F30CF
MVTSQNLAYENCFNVDSVDTLVDLLHSKALYQPNKKAFTFLLDGETQETSLTYLELDLQARAIAAQLQSLGASGERALLLYPAGLEFIAAFFGCLYAGVVAVPAYPPRNNNRSMDRIQAIVADAQATVVLTTTQTLSNVERRFAEAPDLADLRLLTTDNVARDLAEAWQEPAVTGDTLAYLQYTSGSTSKPKGVMISHRNAMHNSADLALAWETKPDSVLVSWLPHFHDFGLVYGIIQPVYQGCSCVLMAPTSFIQQPVRWLQAISRYRATHSGAPNFAYELCISKITPEQRATLDLSSWCVAVNGAEQIRQEALKRFAETFCPCGFRWSTFCPGYGLAEATLKVSASRMTEMPIFCTVQASTLAKHHLIELSENGPDTRTLVGCGGTLLDTKIVIVEPASLTRCLPNQVGEIWVSSSSVAQGYWNRPEETERTFGAYLADTGEGPFLRTGDLGFMKDDQLFVTGRLKDLIIIRGHNHYPQDIELTVEQSHPALQQGCGAAFSVEVNGEERLVVACEVKRSSIRNLDVDAVGKSIDQAVIEQHELQVYAILLLIPIYYEVALNIASRIYSDSQINEVYRNPVLSSFPGQNSYLTFLRKAIVPTTER